MIIVVEESELVDELHRALRSGGFVLRAKPGNIFELRRSDCWMPVSVLEHNRAACARHAAQDLWQDT